MKTRKRLMATALAFIICLMQFVTLTNVSADGELSFSELTFSNGSSIISSLENGDITASITVSNTGASVPMVLIAALYNSDNILIDIHTSTAKQAKASGDTVFSAAVSVTDYTSQKINIYLWDNMVNANPRMDPKSFGARTISDTVPAPLSLRSETPFYTEIGLKWQAPADATGITGYSIYRDDKYIGSTDKSSTAFSDNNVWLNESYTYSVATCKGSLESKSRALISVTMPALTDGAQIILKKDTPQIISKNLTLKTNESPLVESYTAGTAMGGVECHEITDGHYMYLDVDDNYMFVSNNYAIIKVSYFDNGTDKLRVEYVSKDTSIAEIEAWYKPLVIQKTGSGTWKTASFYVNDAAFCNLQNESADLRISSSDEFSDYISRVEVINFNPASFRQKSTTNADFETNFMQFNFTTSSGDIAYTLGTTAKDGVPTRTVNPNKFAFFKVDKAYIKPTDRNITLKITYYDGDSNTFMLEYNSTDTSYKPITFYKTGTKSWITKTIALNDAAFGSYSETEYNFRLSGQGAAFNIRNIEVIKGLVSDSAAIEMGTSNTANTYNKIYPKSGQVDYSEGMLSTIKGKSARKLDTGFMYFDVDDNFINEAGLDVTILITYLDEGTINSNVRILDYLKAVVLPGVPEESWEHVNAKIENTGSWITKVIRTNDISLTNKMGSGTDFRFGSGVYINRIEIIKGKVGYLPATAKLNDPGEMTQIKMTGSTPALSDDSKHVLGLSPDGKTYARYVTRATIPGTENYMTWRMYVNAEDTFITPADSKIAIYVEYYDDAAAGKITLQYNSIGNDEAANYKTISASKSAIATNTWKTAVFIIDDAEFKNAQNSGCDFRISNGDAQDAKLWIRKITVFKRNPSDEGALPVGGLNMKMKLDSNRATMNTTYSTNEYEFASAAVMKNDVVYVPFKETLEAFGGEVKWDANTQKVTFRQPKRPTNTYEFQIGQTTFDTIPATGTKTTTTIVAGTTASTYISTQGSIMVPIDLFKKSLNWATQYNKTSGEINLQVDINYVGWSSPLPAAGVVPIDINPADVAFKFAVSSDAQGTDEGYYIGSDDGVSSMMFNVLKAMGTHNPDFIVGVGDLVAGAEFADGYKDKGTRAQVLADQLQNFRKRFKDVSNYDNVKFPGSPFNISQMWPGVGNHEMKGQTAFEIEYANAFHEFYSNKPGVNFENTKYNKSVWYVDNGGARFYYLNSNHPGEEHLVTGAQLAWLKASIADANANGIKQNFFFIHENPYSTWKLGNGLDYNPKARDEFWKAIDGANGISMLFSGHEHLYSRRLVNNAFGEKVVLGATATSYEFDKQIYQLTIGGFGGGTNGLATDYKNIITSPQAMGIHHFAIVEVLNDGRIHVKVLSVSNNPSEDGKLLDDFIGDSALYNTPQSKTITLDKNSASVDTGDTLQLTATATPANSVTWSSSDTSIATVNQNGFVTVNNTGKSGTVYIAATANAGIPGSYKIAACEITVEKKIATPQTISTTFFGDAKTTRAFTWYTSAGVSGTKIQYAPASGFTNWTTNILTKDGTEYPFDTATLMGSTPTTFGKRMIHKVDISGLTAGTRYKYRVGDGTNWSQDLEFTTEADDSSNTGFTFIHISDPQGADQKAYDTWNNTVNKALEKAPDAKFFAMTGDAIEEGNDEAHWQMYFNSAKPTTGPSYLSNYPFMSVVGNHEMRGLPAASANVPVNFINHFNFPTNAQNLSLGDQVYDIVPNNTVYSYDYGDAHFAVLNTSLDDRKPTAKFFEAQTNWLRQDMAKTKKPWKIVLLHRGPYSGMYNTTDTRQYLTPTFDEIGIDLVLQGHDHRYSRSYSIYNNINVAEGSGAEQKTDGDGTIYLTSSSSGRKLYDTPNSTAQAGWLRINQQYGASDQQGGQMFSTINIKGDTLTVTAYTVGSAPASDGPITQRDSFTIKRNTTLGKPNTVSNVSATLSGDKLTILWNDPASADFSKVWLYNQLGKNNVAPTIISKGTRQAIINGITPGTAYKFIIQAKGKRNFSDEKVVNVSETGAISYN